MNETLSSYYEELYHHGVKGQKWGVRRYQNADGSLTPAGKKRYARNVAYRDKLVAKAQKHADKNSNYANKAKANLIDLKKNGRNSETYKRWKDEQYDSREYEYENKHKITGPNGDTYVKKYSRSGTRLVDDVFDSLLADTQVRDLITQNSADVSYYKKSAEQWMKDKTALMDMKVTAFTKKIDILKEYLSDHS